MTCAANHATVEIPSTAVATTTFPVSVDLGGLLPVWVIARAINRSGTGAGAATTKLSVGFATSTSLLYSTAVAMETGAALSNTARSVSKEALIHETLASAVVGGLIGISDMSTPDQITLIVITQLVETHTIGLQVFAGTDFSNATIIEFTKSSGSTGSTNVTTPGFPVRFAMGMGANVNTYPSNFADCYWTLGRALPASGKNQMVTSRFVDNVAPSDTASYCNDTEFISEISTTGVANYRAAITSQLSTGFVINEIEVGFPNLRKYAILCIGGNFNVAFVSFLTQTDTTTDIQPSVGFTPILADLWSHCRVKSTTDTPQATAEISLGTTLFPSVGGTNFSVGCIDPDNVVPTATASALQLSDAYVNLDSAGAVEGLMRSATDPTDALGLLMSDADPSQYFVAGAVFGAAPPSNPMFIGQPRRSAILQYSVR